MLFRSMFEMMALMESICGRLASRRMTDMERAQLQKQHEVCGDAVRAKDIDLYYTENVRFHGVIYEGSHNKFLAGEVKRLQRRLQAYRRLQLRSTGRMAESYAEHSAITKAIIEGKDELTASLLQGHVSVQGDRFGDWLSSLNAAQLVSDNVGG